MSDQTKKKCILQVNIDKNNGSARPFELKMRKESE